MSQIRGIQQKVRTINMQWQQGQSREFPFEIVANYCLWPLHWWNRDLSYRYSTV